MFWAFVVAKIIDFMWNSHRRSIQLYNPAKMTLSREMSSNDIMVDSRVNSEGGIVFYALEIVWGKLMSTWDR